ncbi:hypothetical protein MXX25_27635 [Klebsiella pneumoniae]|nr:hypothetical protein [Klebsiella pneumoniae]MCB3254977.1 hypothetical protein [Klebsiella pneumoniae]MCB4081788.1 hypothetical protein [Klebsiella pneumoniae]MCF7148792.1 hypothetical protein [Klebsiella pneumoniae]MDG0705235.1 hypothetical protein [Klebsiella pneumoniae]MDG0710818.1 hypothetical protein [Klebsiella pneumoniae]
MFAGKKSAQIREILISESAWEEMTCLFAPSLDALRNHNISFDKTPHPPQEKLIAGLTEAIAAQTKSKFKNEN